LGNIKHLAQLETSNVCRFSYALFFGSRNAKVVVNDVSVEAAQKVVNEVKKGKRRHD
jgi:hypothetical protein